jgi:hypothetical protein
MSAVNIAVIGQGMTYITGIMRHGRHRAAGAASMGALMNWTMEQIKQR